MLGRFVFDRNLGQSFHLTAGSALLPKGDSETVSMGK